MKMRAGDILGMVIVGMAFGWLTRVGLATPTVLRSASTGHNVRCASEDTDWAEKPISDPACQKVLTSGRFEVEWVR